MKYRINFTDDEGKVIHTAYVEARTKQEACRKAEKDPTIKTALQKALNGTCVSCDFYIEPVTSLN